MKYSKLTGIVLKKQNFREADQMITIWTQEAGKVRVMARGLKHAKSKLAYSMQDLCLVEFETAGRGTMPSLIAAKVLKGYPNVRENLSKTVSAFYAVELMLKMTADEQENPEAYQIMLDFLEYLNECESLPEPVFRIVDSFALRLLKSLGFSLEYAQNSIHLPANLRDILNLLSESAYHELPGLPLDDQISKKAHNVVKDFIEFILERNIKSEPFLSGI